MQVILREDVAGLGRTGDVVKAKPGYARNYLIPRGFAVMADPKNLKRIEHEKTIIAKQSVKNKATAEEFKARIEGISVTVSKYAGEQDKLFGSVTAKEIEHALAEEGVTIDKKKIRIDQPIKQLGIHTVSIHLQTDLDASLKVWVVAKK